MWAVSQFPKVSVAWICIQLKLVDQNLFVNDCKIHLKKVIILDHQEQKFFVNSCLKYIYDNLHLFIALMNDLLKTMDEYKNLKRREIQDTLSKWTR